MRLEQIGFIICLFYEEKNNFVASKNFVSNLQSICSVVNGSFLSVQIWNDLNFKFIIAIVSLNWYLFF